VSELVSYNGVEGLWLAKDEVHAVLAAISTSIGTYVRERFPQATDDEVTGIILDVACQVAPAFGFVVDGLEERPVVS
jgi:hypothetical protein